MKQTYYTKFRAKLFQEARDINNHFAEYGLNVSIGLESAPLFGDHSPVSFIIYLNMIDQDIEIEEVNKDKILKCCTKLEYDIKKIFKKIDDVDKRIGGVVYITNDLSYWKFNYGISKSFMKVDLYFKADMALDVLLKSLEN